MEKTTVTYSALSSFMNCRRLYYWRYIENLVSIKQKSSLLFGQAIHALLEQWHKTGDESIVMEKFDELFLNPKNDDEREMKPYILAMIKGYMKRYPTETFKVVDVERHFEHPVLFGENKISRKWDLAGKVDGVVEEDDGLFILEHKTVSNLSGSYIEKIWTDFQIYLYAAVMSRIYGRRIVGAIYNMLCKTTIHQKKSETEEEFIVRLGEKYSEQEMFHREKVLFDPVRLDGILEYVKISTKELDRAKNNGLYYCNTDYCFRWNSACQYYPICSSNDNPMVIQNCYRVEEPHQELREATALSF